MSFADDADFEPDSPMHIEGPKPSFNDFYSGNLQALLSVIRQRQLSMACRKIGFRAAAVDKESVRAKGPITLLDFTEAEDLSFLKDYARNEANNIVLIHAAPPCSICSAPRNNPLTSLATKGFHIPAPLRSMDQPDEFDASRPGPKRSSISKSLISSHQRNRFVGVEFSNSCFNKESQKQFACKIKSS